MHEERYMVVVMRHCFSFLPMDARGSLGVVR